MIVINFLIQMADQIIDEDSQTALPNDEIMSKPEVSEKESTQVCNILNSFI